MRPAFARLSYPIGILLCGVALSAPSANACDSAPQTGDPFFKKASILTPTVNVAKAPGQPALDVTFETGASGLYYIEYYFEGPSPSNAQSAHATVYFFNGLTSGTTKLRSLDTGFGAGLNFYSAPGTWTLDLIVIGDNAGNCVDYAGAALKALMPKTTIEVVNAGTPDTTAPKIAAAKIATPIVSRSAASALVRVDLTMSDNLSGVAEATAYFEMAGENFLSPDVYPPYPVLNGVVSAVEPINPSTAKGIYTVEEINVCDAASNCRSIEKSSELSTLFGGKMTVQITD
jgi:hypothetical protein